MHKDQVIESLTVLAGKADHGTVWIGDRWGKVHQIYDIQVQKVNKQWSLIILAGEEVTNAQD